MLRVKAIVCRFGVALLLIEALSCGGGGRSSQSIRSGVRIIHGAIDYPPVSALSSLTPEPVVSIRFAESSGYAPSGKGQQTITLTVAGSGANLLSEDTALGKRERLTFIVYESSDGHTIKATALKDIEPELIKGRSLLRVANALSSGSAVNARIGSTTLVSALPPGSVSEFTSIPPGTAEFLASLSSDGTPAARISLTLEEKHAYTIALAGEAGYFVSPVLLDE